MLISSLRDVIRNQTNEIEALQRQLKEKTSAGADEVTSVSSHLHPQTADSGLLYSSKSCETKSRACRRSWRPQKGNERMWRRSRRTCSSY
jgi:L-lysine 2,3-aminomutase